MTLGEKLHALRARKGFTQMEFTEFYNKRFPGYKIQRSTYDKWENDRRTPQLSGFKNLVTLHKVTADELLFDHLVPAILKEGKNKRHKVSM